MSGISFFHPVFLWALAALSLPVLAHLLNRQRSRRLDFSTVRFFKASALRSSRVRRLRRFVLLCVRLLMVAVLAALFSKPFNTRSVFSKLTDPGGAVYCWVDPTKSMEYREGPDCVWQKAKGIVDSLDRKLPLSTRRFLYDETRREFEAKTGLTIEEKVAPRCGPANIGTMLRAFETQRRGSRRMDACIVISDFQENICAAMDSFFNAEGRALPVIGVSVAPSKPWNIGIRGAMFRPGRPVFMQTTIAAIGKDFANTGISVVTSGMRAGHEEVFMKNGAFKTLSIPLSDESGGAGGCVQLDVSDPFKFDNIRYFVKGASSSFRVLVVGDSAKSYPIAAALRSIEQSPWRPVMRTPQTVSYEDLDSALIVIVNEIAVISRPLRALIEDRSFVNKPVIVSPCIDKDNSFVGSEIVQSLFKREKFTIANPGKPCTPLLYDTVSSLWKGFPKFRETGARVFRYIDRLPGNVLLSLDNHAPLAVRTTDSSGHAWTLFAAPIGLTTTNNLCETGMYVPLVDRIVRSSLEAIRGETEEWVAGKPRRNPYYTSRTGAFIYDERNRLIAQWNMQQQVVFNEPGLYRIAPVGKTSKWVAVNPDSLEISLKYGIPENAGHMTKRMTFMTSDEFLYGLKSNKSLLYSYGLWLAFALLLIAEMLLWERPLGKPKAGGRRDPDEN